MIEVLIIMTVGIVLGALLRSKQKLISAINRSTMWIIFALLFFMGISVGINEDIMSNLGTIGLQGLFLSLVAILGSVVLSWVLYVLFFKNTYSNNTSNGNDEDV